jgi:hypothetical protein
LIFVGLTEDQRLVWFQECSPERTRHIGHVSGLQGTDTALVGIDFRVQDQKLYGVGNGGGVYAISTDTAEAVLISKLTVALDGTFFGVDFNPAADRLRIISNTGQNLRHNERRRGDPERHRPQLHGGDSRQRAHRCRLHEQRSRSHDRHHAFRRRYEPESDRHPIAPNAGSLVATGQLTVDPDTPVGFDIYTSLEQGTAVTNSGFASLTAGGILGFYRVNFLTGKAILIDYFSDPVIDIAIPLDQ